MTEVTEAPQGRKLDAVLMMLDIVPVLTEVAERRAFITYGELVEQLKERHPEKYARLFAGSNALHVALGHASDWSFEYYGMAITSIVVNKATGMPGDAFMQGVSPNGTACTGSNWHIAGTEVSEVIAWTEHFTLVHSIFAS